MTRRGFIQALGLAIAGAIIPLPKLEEPMIGGHNVYFDDCTGFEPMDFKSQLERMMSYGRFGGDVNFQGQHLELESLESVWPTSS